jgi:hypothetical protein
MVPTGARLVRDSESVVLPPIVLTASESEEADLRPLLKEASRRIDLSEVSVQILSDGAPGALAGSVVVLDRRAQLAYDVPLRDSGPHRQATGSYPWRLDDDYTPRVTITNVGQGSADFSAHIFYPGGRYDFTVQKLAVGETAVFDLRKLRDEQVPDRRGEVLPINLQQGQFRWSVWGASPGARLNGRTELVSESRGVGSSYSCLTCCPDSLKRGAMDPSNPSLIVTQTVYVEAVSIQTDCYGNVTDVYNMPFNNTSIYNPAPQLITAWMQSDGVVGILGNSNGSLNLDVYTPGWDCQPNAEDTDCIYNPATADAIGAVTVNPRLPTYVAIFGNPGYTQGPPAPYVYNVSREILDQLGNPLTGVHFVAESFNPDPPSGSCTNLTVNAQNGNSNDQGIFGPDLYSLPGNAPNPCSSQSIQHFTIDGRDVSPNYAITWQYSQVTVVPQ